MPCLEVPVSGVWVSMASEADAFSPVTPELAIDAPVPDVSVDAMLAILDAFVAKVEAALGRMEG